MRPSPMTWVTLWGTAPQNAVIRRSGTRTDRPEKEYSISQPSR